MDKFLGLRPITVSMFMRRPRRGDFSVERVFDSVRQCLPDDIACRTKTCSRESLGILPRLWITIEAAFHQSQVNHVTGDVHFLTLLMRRRATILTVLDLVTVDRLDGLRRWLFKLLWFRLPIARTQVVTVISSVTRDHLLRELGPLRQEVRVIHCPLMDGYLPSRRPFPSDNPTVLLVGLAANKNLDRTVAALSAVPCTLRVIGVMSPEQKRLLDQSGLPYTAATGLSDDAMRQEYVNCDMLVFASTAEGFGLPILEAQATGRPVVTSNVSSMPEVAGDAAEFVDPFSVDSIRAGVQRVINDAAHREELIRRGFENVKRFSPQAIADQYAALYREVAALNQPRRARR